LAYGLYQFGQTTALHHQVGLRLRQGRAVAERERNLGARQHRAVVHAVAHHGDLRPLGLQGGDDFELALGAGLGHHLGDAQLLRHALHRADLVAREQMDLQAHGAQVGHGCGGIGAHAFVHDEGGEPTLLVTEVGARCVGHAKPLCQQLVLVQPAQGRRAELVNGPIGALEHQAGTGDVAHQIGSDLRHGVGGGSTSV